MTNLIWYAKRAAAMSPREVWWRARTTSAAAMGRRERWRTGDRPVTGTAGDWKTLVQRFRDGSGRAVLLDRAHAGVIAAAYPSAVDALVEQADRLAAGRRRYFGYPAVSVGTVVDWNHDPLAGYRWPAVAAGKIDYRAGGRDPKWIWELNRLQHLPVLAQAWMFTGDRRYAVTALAQLDSWIEQNPVGVGIAWRGAFEAGIRAISVAVAVQGLRDSAELTPARYRRAMEMLDASARYCWHGRSLFSSANNHLVGELTGLIAVHLLVPELSTPASLYPSAIAELERQASLQILPDGSGAEQAVSYQMFTAELLALVVVLLRKSGRGVPAQLTAAIGRSTDYLSAVVGEHDPDPRYGDDDDGFALRLGPEPKRTVRQHLAITGAAAGCTPSVKSESSLTAAWFAADNDACQSVSPASTGRAARGSVYAPDGGLVVLRAGSRRLTMDVGPLGHLSIAAHGHADALAITLSAQGRDVIVDPGTASYYGNPGWRAAHRGTRAHPTVCVDDADQSLAGGPFLWRRHAITTVHSVDLERGIVDAEHDGYRRLGAPVSHRRWLYAPAESATAVVVDLLTGRGTHGASVSWPLHPALGVEPAPDGHVVTREGEIVLQLRYAATVAVAAQQLRADAESHLGWWSDRLEARSPAWLVGARCHAAVPLAMVTVLHTAQARVDAAAPAIDRHGTTLAASWSESGSRHTLTIDTSRFGAVECLSALPDMAVAAQVGAPR